MDDLCDQIDKFNCYKHTEWINSKNLHILIQVASYGIWGGIKITFDADNFYPPAARCWLFSASTMGRSVSGCGNTISEAILRAVWFRENTAEKYASQRVEWRPTEDELKQI